MNKAPLKSSTKIQDLLDMIHLTIIKEKGVNDVILTEIQAIEDKIKSGALIDYDVNTPLYWTAVFADVKNNGYTVIEVDRDIKVGDTVMVCQTKDEFRENNFNVEMEVVAEDGEYTWKVRHHTWEPNVTVTMPKTYCRLKK
jgi:hypothetical protein